MPYILKKKKNRWNKLLTQKSPDDNFTKTLRERILSLEQNININTYEKTMSTLAPKLKSEYKLKPILSHFATSLIPKCYFICLLVILLLSIQ